MEACINCTGKWIKGAKQKIKKEIDAFLKNPNNFNVIYNPITGLYRFEMIKNDT